MTESLSTCRQAFRGGSLDKQAYIAAMHRLHARLFEYPGLLADGDIARIEIDAEGVDAVTRDGVRFRLDPIDRRQPPLDALNFGSFEGADEAMFDRLIGPSDCVFDVGGNVGWYALRWAKSRPQARIVTFEPVPETRRRLEFNLRRNGLANVTVCDFGLSDVDAVITFHVDPALTAGAASVAHNPTAEVRRVTARVRRLDDVSAELGVAPNVLKVDVEGGELAVFRGGRQCLAQHRPIVFCEMLRRWTANFGYHPNAIIDFLAELGYDCFETAGDRLRAMPRMTDSTAATNFVFLHRVQHDSVRRRWVD